MSSCARRSWYAAGLASLLLIGACDTLAKPESTHLSGGADGFTFRAIADAAYPEASENGEQWRMRWLRAALNARGLCPRGYAISSRQVRLLSSGTLGDIADVYYRGQCSCPPRAILHLICRTCA
jgi:hypothetical protein